MSNDVDNKFRKTSTCTYHPPSGSRSSISFARADHLQQDTPSFGPDIICVSDIASSKLTYDHRPPLSQNTTTNSHNIPIVLMLDIL